MGERAGLGPAPFTPDGTLRWEVLGNFFCDVAAADPSDDADTVWGIQERYAMDGEPPGTRFAIWVRLPRPPPLSQ